MDARPDLPAEKRKSNLTRGWSGLQRRGTLRSAVSDIGHCRDLLREKQGAASIILKMSDIEERIYTQKEEVEKAIVRVMDILDYLPQDSLEREICERDTST